MRARGVLNAVVCCQPNTKFFSACAHLWKTLILPTHKEAFRSSFPGRRLGIMSSSSQAAPPSTEKKTPTCKICCACPQQRRARDECTIFKSLEECQAEIAAFYQCLRDEGFSEADVAGLRKNVRAM